MTIQNLAQPLECYCDLMTSFNSFVYMSNLIAIIQHTYFRSGVICSDYGLYDVLAPYFLY